MPTKYVVAYKWHQVKIHYWRISSTILGVFQVRILGLKLHWWTRRLRSFVHPTSKVIGQN